MQTALVTHVLMIFVATSAPSRANGSAIPAHPITTVKALCTARSTPAAPLVRSFSHPANNNSAFGSAAKSSKSSPGTVADATSLSGASTSSANERNLTCMDGKRRRKGVRVKKERAPLRLLPAESQRSLLATGRKRREVLKMPCASSGHTRLFSIRVSACPRVRVST